jgi:hypothetical protein
MPTTTIMLPVNAATINIAHANSDTIDRRSAQFASLNIASHPTDAYEVEHNRRNRRLRSGNTSMTHGDLSTPAVGSALSCSLAVTGPPVPARHLRLKAIRGDPPA